MNYLSSFFISQTVLLPLILGICRLNRMVSSFFPFMLLLLVAFICECVSFFCIVVLRSSNALVLNVHGLLEGLLIVYQFHQWSMLKKKKLIFSILGAAFIVVWLIENIACWKITDFSPFYRVFYSFSIVLLSVNQINYMITQDSSNLLKSAAFLICIGFITFFIYQIIYEAAFFVGQYYIEIANQIIQLFGFMNAFINMLFTLAVYHIPVKDEYYFNKHFK